MESKFKNHLCLLIICLWVASTSGGGILWSDDVEFPAIQAFGAFSLTDSTALREKEWKWQLTLHHANINLIHDLPHATVNMEWTALTLTTRYGLAPRLTLEGALRWDGSSNGFLDRVIEGFHNALGLPNGGREFSPKNELDYRIGTLFSFLGKGSGPLFAPHLALFWTPLESPNWTLGLRAGLTVHFNDLTAYRSAGLIPVLGLSAQYRLPKGSLYLSAHWRPVYRSPWLGNTLLDSSIWLLQWGLEYKALRLGLTLKSSPFSSGRIGQDARQIYLGLKLCRWFELGIYEELFHYTTVADIGVRLRFLW